HLSRENGIAVIYQEFTLVPVLSAAENIFMGDFPMKGAALDQKEMVKRTNQLFEKLNIKIDPNTLVSDLTTGYQQMVEIAKALSRNAKLLIMDEPSAPLTTSEVEAMFRVVDTLKMQGVTIIYISHRMKEIFRLSDRVSVMRDGNYITVRNTKETDEKELIKLMVGRELNETFPPRDLKIGETLLKIEELTGNGVKDISLEVKEGEILGLAGLIGAGRTELAQLIFGYGRIDSGKMYFEGKEYLPHMPSDAIKQGIALVPEDRKRQGLVLEMSILQNSTMALLKSISSMSVIDKKKENKITDEYIESLSIKTPGSSQKVKNLSGGNQQKVVLAKWLAVQPKLLIFDEPTRGIDVGAKQEIYMIMSELVHMGKTIIIISSEMEELIGMSDRIIVLAGGRISGELKKEEFSQELILEKSAKG
ncbi:MAG: sugar ABC transporter ATP-binding protein, partial [Oscillospiraceae bacterium]